LIKLAVFDFDSTLMDGETIDFFADALGIGPQVSAITERAMNGELDFFESLQQRVGLLKGLEFSKVEKITLTLSVTCFRSSNEALIPLVKEESM